MPVSTKKIYKATLLTLVCAILLSPAAAFANDGEVYASADKITVNQELRARLDSIELEKQVRKRQGKPIDDLEAAGAQIRDSLQDMRDAVADAYRANPQAFDDDKKGFSFSLTGMFPNLPEVILSFRPQGLFDWVMVATGAVAILSLIMLLFGILAGRGKREGKQTKDKKKIVARKMDLGTDARTPNAGMGGDINNNAHGDASGTGNRSGDGGDNLQSLMEHLRKLTPQTQTPQSPSTKQTPRINDDELPPMPAAPPPPPPPPPKPKEPPPPPPPLIVNVPDPPTAAALDKSAGETMSVNDLVISAAGSGMSELEISRRYQVSVDQVRLILRMNQ